MRTLSPQTELIRSSGGGWSRKGIAERAAQELSPGSYVNLGVGIPLLIPDFLDADDEIFLHSENGILGLGPVSDFPDRMLEKGLVGEAEGDWDLVDAGKGFASMRAGASCFDSAMSFGIVRSGRLDLAVLGGMQVAANGDLANWTAPGRPPGVGGAMDLVHGAKHTWVLMEHTNRAGVSKLVSGCSLPLTGIGVVSKVITELGVFVPEGTSFRVAELAPGVEREMVESATEAELDW